MKKNLWIFAVLSAMLFLLGVGKFYPVYAAEAGKAEVSVTGANVWNDYRVSQSFYRRAGDEEWTEMEREGNKYTVYLEPGQYEYMAKISEYADNDEDKPVTKDKYTRQGVFDIKESNRSFDISFALFWLRVTTELDESLFPNGLPGINMTVIKDGEDLTPEETVPSKDGQGIKEAFYIIDHIGTDPRSWDFIDSLNYYSGGYELKIEVPEDSGFDYAGPLTLPRFYNTSFYVGSANIPLVETRIIDHTIKVPKGAGLHLYQFKRMAYAGMEEQTVSKTATEGDYDVYTCALKPHNRIAYVTGGKGTDFKRTAGFFDTDTTEPERTIDAVPKGSVSPGITNKNNDLYTNVRDGFKRITVGAPDNRRFSLEAYRMTQTVMTETTKEFIEPEMDCTIIHSEIDAGTRVRATRIGDFGRYKYNVSFPAKATTGLAVIKITYDEMDKDGTHYPAIDDADTGIVFVQLGGTSEGITPSMTQYDRGEDSQSPRRNDFDTVYFLGTTSLPGKEPALGKGSTEYTFNAGEGTQVFVHDPVRAADTTFDNTAWTEYPVDEKGDCKVTLKNGRNPIKITKGESVLYIVINAKELDVNVANISRPGKEIAARDKVGVSFEGLELPVYKMSCVYNPGWKEQGDQTWVEYTLNGKDTVDSPHIQYPIATINTIEFKAAEGENTLSQGQIHCTHMGSGLYEHTEIPSIGLDHNFNASPGANSPWFNIMPEITFTARALTEEEEKDANVKEVEELIDKVADYRDDPRYAMTELLDALDAYEALDEALKPSVSNADVLTEVYYGKDETDIVRRMVAAIRDIQELPETAAKENAVDIQNAKAEFDALGEENTILIPKIYQDKLSGLADALEQILADEVIDMITDLSAVTADNCIEKQEAIRQARAAYEALGESARKKVTNLSDLEAAETLLRAADPAMAAVEDQIKAIGEVTAANWKEKQETIGQARAAYEALSEESKARVSNLKTLTDAEAVVSAGQAEEVIVQINAIGDVTADNWNGKQTAIGQARAAYNALPESAQALVTNLGRLQAAEATVQDRTVAINDAAAKINAIGGVTAANWKERREAIRQARAAYNALSANERYQIAGAEALTAAEAVVDQGEAGEVIAQINAIGEVTAANWREKQDAIGQARTAYNALSANAKSLVTNLAALEAAEAAIQAADAAVADVIAKITVIGEVTHENWNERQTAVTEARTAYEALTQQQRALVTNYPALTAAEAVVADAQAVKAVEDRIAAIGEVTAENWREKDAAVAGARTAYDALPESQRALVSDYAALQAAEAFIQTDVVDPVKAKIDQIGTLSETDCKEKEPLVIEARAMYDGLTDRLRAMISNYAVLENAEAFLNEYNSVDHEMKAFQESAVQGLKAEAVSCTAVRLTWDPLKDADSYRVYRRVSGGAWSQIAAVSRCGYTDDKAAVGKAYAYRVAGVSSRWGDGVMSRESTIATCTLKLGRTTLTSVRSKDYRTLKLTWKRVTGASGYTVYRAAQKNGAYRAIAQVRKGGATTYEDTKRTTGVTYHYRVRAYRTVNGETGYGEPSAIKSGKASPAAPKTSVKSGRRSAAVKKRSYADKGLKSKKTYHYRVRAYRTVGKKRVYGSFSAVKTVRTR